jgi:pyruvate formate lyase activating enzyme
MEKAARYVTGGVTYSVVNCRLCPRECKITDGNFGFCRIRSNKNGTCVIPFYGYVTSLAVDPIEKKPLYHFRPGSRILSVGFTGCNLRCPFCQNWRISQLTNIPGTRMSPKELISAVLHEGGSPSGGAIAYTYSEPLVHAEFLLDCMKLARKNGIANVLVTNGCVNAEAADDILSFTDAANVDLKCFSHKSYTSILSGTDSESAIMLDTVLAFIRLAVNKGVHTELTTLIVPGFNDSTEELDACADFIASLGNKPGAAAWHLSAYHPDFNWEAPPTDPDFLLRTRDRVAGKVRYVYTGNIRVKDNATMCPGCGAYLVRRFDRGIDTGGLARPEPGDVYYKCSRCSSLTNIRC